jgi:hypothetical protein
MEVMVPRLLALTGLVAVALTFQACAAPAAPTQAVEVTGAEQNDDSNLSAPGTFVIRDAAELRRVWTELFGDRPARPLPAIDFSRHMLVIVAIGEQPTSGFQVRIGRAERTPRGIVVHVTVLRPGPDCVVNQVITRPVGIARLPQTDRPVRFEFERGVAPCRDR